MRKIISFILSLCVIGCLLPYTAYTVIAAEAEPTLKIALGNVAFEDAVNVLYAVKADNADSVKLLIWREPQEEYLIGTQSATITNYTTQKINGVEHLVFRFTGVATKQMADDMYVRAYTAKNGQEYYSDVLKYSILEYAYNKIGKTGTASTNSAFIELLNSMLEYGAAAQKYFNYHTDRLANGEYYQVKVENGTLPDKMTKGLYAPGDKVVITAESVNGEGQAFSHWENSAGTSVATTASYTVTVGTKNEKYTAVYGTVSAPSASEGLLFEVDDEMGEAILLGIGTCTDTHVVIPDTYQGCPVVSISSSAFAGTEITSIYIPESVVEVGRRAFNDCDLQEVYYAGTEEKWNDIAISTYNAPLVNAVKKFNSNGTVSVAQYTVVFKDYDGRVIKSETVNAGENAVPPTNPVRAGYTFSKWSGSYTNVSADVEIIAVYTKDAVSANKYTVNFLGYDNSIIDTQVVNEGESAVLPVAPAKAGATFLGWHGTYACVTENTSVQAVYSDERNVLMVSSATGAIGDTVKVKVSVDGDVKTCGFDVNIFYDEDLELISCDDDLDLSVVVNTAAFTNGLKLNFSDVKDKVKQRDAIELTFKIKSTEKSALPITMSVNSIKEIIDNNPANSAYSIVDGAVFIN